MSGAVTATATGTWCGQSSLTIVATVRDGSLDALRGLLEEMAGDPGHNRVLPFAGLGNVHFARLFITDAARAPDGDPIAARLVLMSDVDGSADAHLDQLAGRGGVDVIFGHCRTYPAQRPVDVAARRAYLRRHMVTNGVNYVNTIGRTVVQVHGEATLRTAIEDFLDRERTTLVDLGARAVRGAIRGFVGAEPSLQWALSAAPVAPLGHRVRETARFAVAVLVTIALSPILLPVVLLWLVVVRIHEARDPMSHAGPSAAHLTALRAIEDHAAQNQFTALGFVKPGWFRAVTARVILGLIGFGARHIFNNGTLAGVKTIHFARWVPLDGRRRIVFCSNFDGSTESYMDDFIDKVAWGLNAIFSNGLGYPSTRWLIFGGARNETVFKSFLRAHQLPTQVWFAAYDRCTALNIVNNARIRAGLCGEMTETRARAWLRLL